MRGSGGFDPTTNMRRMRFLIQIVLAALVTIAVGVSLLFITRIVRWLRPGSMFPTRPGFRSASQGHVNWSEFTKSIRSMARWTRIAILRSAM
jgi:hypothetical protein